MDGRCLTDGECSGLLAGTLDAETLGFVEQHLEICVDCQSLLDRLSHPVDEIDRLVSTRQGALERLQAEHSRQDGSEPQLSSDGNLDDEADARPLSEDSAPANLAAHSQTPQADGESTGRGSTPTSGLTRKHDPFATMATASDLSDYEILDEIGRGGMGVVYVARHRTLDRRVAIKMLLTGPHSGARERARFDREARAAARLHHPNIVALHGIGEHDGCPFLVMEFVDGPGLNAEAKSRSIAPREVARIVEIAARAIHHAHCEGVVHRDLKPGNILLAQHKSSVSDSRSGMMPEDVLSGTPKIADFGLALSFDPETRDTATKFTRTGQFLGTPDFMAPEQVDGTDQVGPAADIYSLGATLYALLTGSSPHQAPSPVELLQSIRDTAPVRPRQLKDGIPRDLETICLKCLEKEPAARYGSALMLAEDLRRFLGDEPVLARRTPVSERFVRWCRRNPIVTSLSGLSVLLVLIVAIVSLEGWRRTHDALGVADAAKTKAEESDQRTGETLATLRDVSNAQRRELVQYTVRRGFEELEEHGVEVGAMWMLRAMELDVRNDNTEPTDKTVDDDGNAETSDDRDHRRTHRLRLAGVLQDRVSMTPVTVLRDLALYHGGDFVPHHDRLLIPKMTDRRHFQLHLVDTRSGQRETVDYPIRLGDRLLKFATSPDHRFQLFANLEDGRMPLVNVESRQVHAILEAGLPIRFGSCIAFSPNGRFLAALREDGMLRVWDVDAPGQFRDVQTGESATSDPATTDRRIGVAISQSGGKAVVVGKQLSVWNVHSGKAMSQDPDAGGPWKIELCVGDRFLIVQRGAHVSIRDLAQRKVIRDFSGATGYAIEARRVRAAIIQSSGAVQVFDLQTGEPVSGVLQHDAKVTNVWFVNTLEGRHVRPQPDGSPPPAAVQRQIDDTIYTAEEGRTVRRWSLASARPTSPPLRHPGRIHSIGQDGNRLLTLSGSIVWSVLAWELPPLPARSSPHNVPLDFSSDGRLLVFRANTRMKFEIYDTETGELHGEPIPYPKSTSGHFRAAFSPDNRRLMINLTHLNRVEVIDLATGDVLGEIPAPDGRLIRDMDYTSAPDVIALAIDRTTRIIDRDGLTVRHEITRKERQRSVTVGRTSLSPDGRFVLSRQGYPDYFDLIDTSSGEFVGHLFFQDRLARDDCWSPDSRRVAVGLTSGEARIWTPLSDTPDVVMRHGHDVIAVQFSGDGQWLATGSRDGFARVWDAATGELVGSAMPHEHPVIAVRLSPDRSLAVTIDEQRTVNLWHVATGQRVLTPQRHPGSGPVLTRFSPTGDHLLISSSGTPLRRIPLQPLPADTDFAALRRSLEVQSTFRLAGDGSLIVLPIEELKSRADVSPTKTAPIMVPE